MVIRNARPIKVVPRTLTMHKRSATPVILKALLSHVNPQMNAAIGNCK